MPSSSIAGVDEANSGGKFGAGVTISINLDNPSLRNINMVASNVQFKIQADPGQTVVITGFQVSTLATVGVLSTIFYSTSENTGYNLRGSLDTLAIGTNTLDFSSNPVTLSDGGIGYFRFASAASVIVFDPIQTTPVFAFVPEPSTYAMSATGVAVLGYAVRKRRKKAANGSDV